MTPAADAVVLAVLLMLCLLAGMWLGPRRPFLHRRLEHRMRDLDISALLLWTLMVSDALLLVLLLRAAWPLG